MITCGFTNQWIGMIAMFWVVIALIKMIKCTFWETCLSLCFRVPQVQMEVLAVKGRRYDCFRTTSAHEIIVSVQLFGFSRVQQNEKTLSVVQDSPTVNVEIFFSLVSRQSQQTLLKRIIGFSRTEGKLLPASIRYPVRVTVADWSFSKH